MAKSARAKALDKIRKRFTRAADRLRNEAKRTKGVIANFLNSQAERMRDAAREFTVKNLRNTYGNDNLDAAIKSLDKSTARTLASAGLVERETALGEALISNPDIASRFYAGTIEIWRGKTGEARDAAILDFFGADNIYQVMQTLTESTGEDILALGESEEDRYATVKDVIREEVAARLALG